MKNTKKIIAMLFLIGNHASIAHDNCKALPKADDLARDPYWWKTLYNLEKKHRNCKDLLRSPESSKLVITLLVNRFKNFKDIAVLMRQDQYFRDFILNNVNSSGSVYSLSQLEGLLKKSCPNQITDICKKISMQIQHNLNQMEDSAFE